MYLEGPVLSTLPRYLQFVPDSSGATCSHPHPTHAKIKQDRLPKNSRENRRKKKKKRAPWLALLPPAPRRRAGDEPGSGNDARCTSSAPLHLGSIGAALQRDANGGQVRSAPQDACAEPSETRPQPRPPLRGGIPPSWAGRQLFSSWWNVPLETVPRGLFSPPTPGRTVINTATNAHDANWQRECNTSPLLQPNWANCFPFFASPFGLFWFRTHPTGAFLKTCQWLVFVF